MKTPIITTLEDALSFELGMLYDAEAILTERLGQLTSGVTSKNLKDICVKYAEDGAYKRVKIKRMFFYLARESMGKQDEVVRAFLKDIAYCLHYTPETAMADFLLAGILLKLNHYKIDAYRSAGRMAMKLKGNGITELIGELIDWESKTKTELLDISARLYNDESTFH